MSQVETIILIIFCILASPILILGIIDLSMFAISDIILKYNEIRKELIKNEIRNKREN